MAGSSFAVRCWVIALLLVFAGTAASKPIPLSQPLDLRDKRVVVFAAMGRLAATSRTRLDLLGSTAGFRQRFFPVPIDLDAIVAREAAAVLRELGARPEVVVLDYRDEDLYDVDALVRTRKLSSFSPSRRDAWARDLLQQHSADALLFIHSAEKYVGRYAPPVRHFGLYFPPGEMPANSYVHMAQALYERNRDGALVLRSATATAPLDNFPIAAPVDGAEPEPELTDAQWQAARPSLELAAARGARALVKDVQRRALSPRSSATETRNRAAPGEDGVTFWGI